MTILSPPPSTDTQRLARVETRLDEISGQLQTLIAAQRPFVELASELGPIATQVMSTSVDQCAHLEERGYFAFAREIKNLVDRLVEDYDPSDLHALADNAANILDTVRALTQPSVMAAVRDAAESFDHARDLKPVGMFGLVRKLNGEPNVRRGLAFGLDLVGRIGRAVYRAPRSSRKHTQALTSGAVAKPAPRNSAGVDPAHKASAAAVSGSEEADAEWTRDTGSTRAAELGVDELSEAHWRLIEGVRREYDKSGSTPNIRKISHTCDVTTREIYTLFPHAPGLTIARIAGVPKPVGCL